MSETCIPVVNKPPEEATTEAQTTTTTVEDVTCPGVATNDTLTEAHTALDIFRFAAFFLGAKAPQELAQEKKI